MAGRTRRVSFVEIECSPRPSALTMSSFAGALYPLYHKVDTGRQAKVSFAELEDALAPIFTMPWGVIRERLLDGKVRALSSLSPVDAAKLRFLQIFKCAFSPLCSSLRLLTPPHQCRSSPRASHRRRRMQDV